LYVGHCGCVTLEPLAAETVASLFLPSATLLAKTTLLLQNESPV
jgi:hypothetical protein